MNSDCAIVLLLNSLPPVDLLDTGNRLPPTDHVQRVCGLRKKTGCVVSIYFLECECTTAVEFPPAFKPTSLALVMMKFDAESGRDRGAHED